MKKSIDMHVYAKTIYWTLLNYFQVYRSLSTGMIEATEKAKHGSDQAVEDANRAT